MSSWTLAEIQKLELTLKVYRPQKRLNRKQFPLPKWLEQLREKN